MAYCRFSDGDVYLYDHADDTGLICCDCRIVEAGISTKWHGMSRVEAITHLAEHAERGHSFPHEAVTELLAEIVEAVSPAVKAREVERNDEASKGMIALFAEMKDYQRCGGCGHEDLATCPKCGGNDISHYSRWQGPAPGEEPGT